MFDSRPGSEGEAPSLQCVITCLEHTQASSPSVPCRISITRSSLSIVIYSLYCFRYSWWCLIPFSQCCKKTPKNPKLVKNCWKVATLSRKKKVLISIVLLLVVRLDFMFAKCTHIFLNKTYWKVDTSLEPAAVCIVFQIYSCLCFVYRSVETQGLQYIVVLLAVSLIHCYTSLFRSSFCFFLVVIVVLFIHT